MATLVTADPHLPVLHRPAIAQHPAHGLREQGPLGDLDPLVQRLLVVVVCTGTAAWAMIGPLSRPASTRNTVQPVTFTP